MGKNMSTSKSRPLLTFALISYSQANFIREAVEGAFAQTYSPLEIILSDDRSPDNTFEIMQEMANNYHGPHKIILNRNQVNLGIGGHINRIMQLSSGQMIVIAAGDDISVPERVQRLFDVFESSNGESKSIFSNNLLIDTKGSDCGVQITLPPNCSELVPERIIEKKDLGILPGSSHAWSREVFDVFGPLLTPITCEDMVIPFRSALLGQIQYIDETLVKARRHDNNISQYVLKDPLKHVKFQIFEKEAIFKNWLKDLEKYEAINPDNRKRVKLLRGRIFELLICAQADILLNNSSWVKRVLLLIGQILRGTPLRVIRHRIGIFLIPNVYLKYMFLKCKRRNH